MPPPLQPPRLLSAARLRLPARIRQGVKTPPAPMLLRTTSAPSPDTCQPYPPEAAPTSASELLAESPGKPLICDAPTPVDSPPAIRARLRLAARWRSARL